MPLQEYRKKRDFEKTPEPAGSAISEGRAFVVHKHAARNLHYDLRLEYGGVLKSWAVPKGPSLIPEEKRLAVEVEDHPVEYADFEGVIPHGEYGAGTVIVWDRGTWSPVNGDPAAKLAKGHLDFRLSGSKLSGVWTLLRTRTNREGKNQWLLWKKRDDSEPPGGGDAELDPKSVKTGRSLEQVAAQESGDPALRMRTERQAKLADQAPAAQTTPGDSKEDGPPAIDPELATRAEQAPEGAEWVHEIKYDGYRILAWIADGRVRLYSRRKIDWTAHFPAIAEALARLPVDKALLDGEIVSRNPEGMIRFQDLQNAMQEKKPVALEYYLFDLLHLNGYSTRSLPLSQRKELLETLLARVRETEPLLRFSESIRGEGPAVFRAACRSKFEGIVSKRADSLYLGGRTRDWVKTKCLEEREFVVGGFTLEANASGKIGALLLGYYRDGKLVYSGRVGSGFTENDRGTLFRQLTASQVEASPFAELPQAELTAGDRWTEPRLVVEVRFAEWTDEGLLRQPVFEGIREDKPAEDVGPEETVSREPGESPFVRILPARKGNPAGTDTAVIGGVRISHPSKVMFPRPGLTKRDLAEYYVRVADGILPEIRRRPLVLVRCPEGAEGECFFQKHAEPGIPETLPQIRIPGSGDERPFLYVESISDILGLVQADTLEFHTWGSLVDSPLHPDRIVFDLDPDPAIDPAQTIGAALELKRELESAGLASFARTTGGKGLHIVVPIDPDSGWDAVKEFAGMIARRLMRADPERRTVAMAKSGRGGKILIDYFRNMRGASAIVNYSVRARDGAPVAVPLLWEEVRPGLQFNGWSIGEAGARWQSLGDPWKDIRNIHQRLPVLDESVKKNRRR